VESSDPSYRCSNGVTNLLSLREGPLLAVVVLQIVGVGAGILLLAGLWTLCRVRWQPLQKRGSLFRTPFRIPAALGVPSRWRSSTPFWRWSGLGMVRRMPACWQETHRCAGTLGRSFSPPKSASVRSHDRSKRQADYIATPRHDYCGLAAGGKGSTISHTNGDQMTWNELDRLRVDVMARVVERPDRSRKRPRRSPSNPGRHQTAALERIKRQAVICPVTPPEGRPERNTFAWKFEHLGTP
jgi:hypothetical protein